MSLKLTTSRAKIRTFAQDLETERHKQGHTQPHPTTPAKPVAPSPAPKPIPKPEVQTPKEPEKKIIQEAPIKVATKKAPAPKKEKKQKAAPITITMPKAAHEPESTGSPFSSTQIPAFHEAQKNKNRSEGAKPNIGYDATVITDNKQRQFKLFPSVIQSVQKWFKKITAKKTVAPKYTVADTKHRKGVIQKATTKTGTIFTADSDTLKEQIRKRRLKEQEDEAQKIEEGEAETIWSPYTDSGYALLEDAEPEEDVTQNATVAYKQISETKTVIAIPLEAEHEPEEEPLDTTSEEDLADVRWSTPKATTPEPTTTFVPTPPEITDTEPPTEEAPTPEQPKKEKTDSLIHQFDTNTLTIVLLVMVIGFVTILFVSKVVIDYLNQPEPVVSYVALSDNESILKGTQVVDLTVTNSNLVSLPTLINNGVTDAPVGLVEMIFVSPIGEEISPSYLFELLRFKTSPPLRQNITTARVVTINNSAPALLFHFIEKETVRGEMLSWEPSLVEDFKRLYNLPEIGVSNFVDVTVEGTEVRAVSVDDKTILMYGFIGPNTLLFTSNQSDFAQITQLNTTD